MVPLAVATLLACSGGRPSDADRGMDGGWSGAAHGAPGRPRRRHRARCRSVVRGCGLVTEHRDPPRHRRRVLAGDGHRGPARHRSPRATLPAHGAARRSCGRRPAAHCIAAPASTGRRVHCRPAGGHAAERKHHGDRATCRRPSAGHASRGNRHVAPHRRRLGRAGRRMGLGRDPQWAPAGSRARRARARSLPNRRDAPRGAPLSRPARWGNG